MNIKGRNIVENKIIKKIYKTGNLHVLYFWDSLNDEEKNELIKSLSKVNFINLKKYYKKFKKNETKKYHLSETDFYSYEKSADNETLKIIGEKALSSNQVGFLTVAGGQGSRLDYHHPKGSFPISPVKKKSLFQIFAEKIKFYSNHYNSEFYWFIMTSQENNEETQTFFIKNNYFGLNKNHIVFFNQGMIPSLTIEGKLILEAENRIFKNPDGHGGILKALSKSGLLKFMKKSDIKHLIYFQVDNPMVDMCDPYFIGYHVNQNSQVSSKVIKKTYPEEKLGVICKVNKKNHVVEYSDLSTEDMNKKDDNGNLKYSMGSIAIHIFKTNFLINCSKVMPVHFALKKVEGFDFTNNNPVKKEIKAVKFELFIFDSIPMARNSVFFETKREVEFYPLKNKDGVDSIETCTNGQIELFKNWLIKAGLLSEPQLNNINVEISPLFAPNQELFLMKAKNNVEKINKCLYDDKGNINANIYIE